MYNRYFRPEDCVPVEPEGKGEQGERPQPFSLLSALLGDRGEETGPAAGLLSRLGLDGGDALLLLLFYYLYRETGDEEWLILLALLLLTGL